MNKTKVCEKCVEMRDISTHLYELAKVCTYLNNDADFVSKDRVRIVKTDNLGQWLKLASQIKEVKIDAWAFSGIDSMWCRPAAEEIYSESSHFTSYSTPLTKFIFIYNALEEMYKFLAWRYDEWANKGGIKRKERREQPSLKTSKLLENTQSLITPKHFEHLVLNYRLSYIRYQEKFDLELSAATLAYNSQVNFGLDLLRNLRNHIAHGVFPIVEDPEYGGDLTGKEKCIIINLLNRSCRLAAIYIQILLRNFNDGIKNSDAYSIMSPYINDISANPDSFFLDYISTLHIKQEFGFNPKDYEELIDRIEC